jgi:hypothetical protein
MSISRKAMLAFCSWIVLSACGGASVPEGSELEAVEPTTVADHDDPANDVVVIGQDLIAGCTVRISQPWRPSGTRKVSLRGTFGCSSSKRFSPLLIHNQYLKDGSGQWFQATAPWDADITRTGAFTYSVVASHPCSVGKAGYNGNFEVCEVRPDGSAVFNCTRVSSGTQVIFPKC